VFDLPKYGDGICLARLAQLLGILGVDRDRLQRNSVVVTGSNGKGSTAAFCAAIGRAYGMRAGLFISPHLYRFNERFQVDGAEIGDDDLARLTSKVATEISDVSRQRGETFGAFEAMFALACLYFQESECTFAVFEAGIGGRYDPVRLVGALVTTVVSVDYEHVNLLGHSLELIASDKSATIRFPVWRLRFQSPRRRLAGHVPVQQRGDCAQLVSAVAGTRAPCRTAQRDRSGRTNRPARHPLARPP
jgi:dihydrofolate synthase/folylpolyglutamate synthase